MLRTPLCDLLGIELPIVQAPIGPWASPELAAAVSNAGGLGSVVFVGTSHEGVKADLDRVRELTDRPYAVNQVLRRFDEETFRMTVQAQPAATWFALGDPRPELVQRSHDAGALVIHQVHTVAQAVQAAERAVDVIVAQGGEAGGFGGMISTLALVPQVVDAVAPLPVVAAGGIAAAGVSPPSSPWGRRRQASARASSPPRSRGPAKPGGRRSWTRSRRRP